MSPRKECSASDANGVVVMIGITIVLAAIILFQFIQLPALYYNTEIPTIFEITSIRHTNQYGVLNYESYMVIKNIGDVSYDNRKLYAKTIRNGQILPCFIPTLNGNDFIPTHHFGIQTMGGFGTHDFSWYPQATVYIDYAQGTFHPGDIVRFEVYDRDSDQIISRDTWPHTSDSTKKWLDMLF